VGATMYRGGWSHQTDTLMQLEKQWKAGIIRVAELKISLDVGRFGTYRTLLRRMVCTRASARTHHEAYVKQRPWSSTVCRFQRATCCFIWSTSTKRSLRRTAAWSRRTSPWRSSIAVLLLSTLDAFPCSHTYCVQHTTDCPTAPVTHREQPARIKVCDQAGFPCYTCHHTTLESKASLAIRPDQTLWVPA
jgi:hypothetical protein